MHNRRQRESHRRVMNAVSGILAFSVVFLLFLELYEMNARGHRVVTADAKEGHEEGEGEDWFKNVLVTGIPRSGTTIVGEMASLLSTQRLVEEPTNPTRRDAAVCLGFVPSQQRSPFVEQWVEVHTWSGAEQRDATDYLARVFAVCGGEAGERVILKDASILPSAEWMQYIFNMRVVVVLRHPAAVINSWRALRWEAGDIGRLIALHNRWMDEHIVPLWEERHEEQANWLFLKHEDFCDDPLGFTLRLQHFIERRSLGPFERGLLDYKVDQLTADTSLPLAHHGYRVTQLNPSAQKDNWRHELSAGDIARIHNGVAGHSPFYGEEEW